jgi:hypothetical protein
MNEAAIGADPIADHFDQAARSLAPVHAGLAEGIELAGPRQIQTHPIRPADEIEFEAAELHEIAQAAARAVEAAGGVRAFVIDKDEAGRLLASYENIKRRQIAMDQAGGVKAGDFAPKLANQLAARRQIACGQKSGEHAAVNFAGGKYRAAADTLFADHQNRGGTDTAARRFKRASHRTACARADDYPSYPIESARPIVDFEIDDAGWSRRARHPLHEGRGVSRTAQRRSAFAASSGLGAADQVIAKALIQIMAKALIGQFAPD